MTSIQVMTWNVQNARPGRTRHQAHWLTTNHPADILVLTEVSAGHSGNLWAELLTADEYSVHLPETTSEDRYRVLLAARNATVKPIDSGIMLPHRAIAAHISFATGNIGIVGLYVPSRGPKHLRNIAKRAFQESVTAQLTNLSDYFDAEQPILITGDLNVVEPDHQPRYSVFGQWEYDFYRSFATNGFIDAYRYIHPSTQEHSWFGRPNTHGQRNGYRFDHTFLTTQHHQHITNCHYLHEPRKTGLSDHSALATTITQLA